MNDCADQPSPMRAVVIVFLYFAFIGAFVWVASATSGWPNTQKDDALAPVADLPGGFSRPVLALQFIGLDEVDALMRPVENYDKLAQLRSSLCRDYFFIVAYTTLLLILGSLFLKCQRRWWVWLGVVVMAGAVGAGVADCVENWYSFKLLDDFHAGRLPVLGPLHGAVYTKWALLFVVTGCLGFLPFAWPAVSGNIGRLATGACWMLALCCGAASLAGVIGFANRPCIEKTSFAMSIVWFWVAIYPACRCVRKWWAHRAAPVSTCPAR